MRPYRPQAPPPEPLHPDVAASRLRVSRRRALLIGGTVGMGGVLAACASPATSTDVATTSAAATTGGEPPLAAASAVDLLDTASRCVTTSEETQGPYWFDVDAIRSDIREDRPGAALDLAIRAENITGCAVDGSGAVPIPNAVVEIWHCDAGGVYSGFEVSSIAANGGRPGGSPAGASGSTGPGSGPGQVSDGSYTVGTREGSTTDDGTYLRGAQVTDANGVVTFTTIFPGWYTGRTTHIHLKVHIDRSTALTSQIYFPEGTIAEINELAPYSDHPGWQDNTRNDTDGIFDPSGMSTVAHNGDRYLAAINLGITV